MKCRWCGHAFTPRATSGKRQRFCRPACRRNLDAAGRRWVAGAIAAGALTIPDLRNASSTMRALAGAGKISSETPLLVPEPPGPVPAGVAATADDAPAPVAPGGGGRGAAMRLADSTPRGCPRSRSPRRACRTAQTLSWRRTVGKSPRFPSRPPGKSRAVAAGPIFPYRPISADWKPAR